MVGTKLERVLPKNQLTLKRKLLNFENWIQYDDSQAKTFLILYPLFENSTTHSAILQVSFPIMPWYIGIQLLDAFFQYYGLAERKAFNMASIVEYHLEKLY